MPRHCCLSLRLFAHHWALSLSPDQNLQRADILSRGYFRCFAHALVCIDGTPVCPHRTRKICGERDGQCCDILGTPLLLQTAFEHRTWPTHRAGSDTAFPTARLTELSHVQVERAAQSSHRTVEVAKDEKGNQDHCGSDHVPEPRSMKKWLGPRKDHHYCNSAACDW